MSFDNNYPNRKDRRKAYRKSKAFDRHCRPNGSCSYCRNNRLYGSKRREPLIEVPVDTDHTMTHEQMASALEKVSKPAGESVSLKHGIDYDKVF